MKNKNLSFSLAKKYLGKEVEVVIDRPLGSKHPEYGFKYKANYGYVPGTEAPDGEELDAYFLGGNKPVRKGRGKCIAVIHRLNDDDDKLVVVVQGKEEMKDGEIKKAVSFQEKWFEWEIRR